MYASLPATCHQGLCVMHLLAPLFSSFDASIAMCRSKTCLKLHRRDQVMLHQRKERMSLACQQCLKEHDSLFPDPDCPSQFCCLSALHFCKFPMSAVCILLVLLLLYGVVRCVGPKSQCIACFMSDILITVK